jgi:hypothetical protein
VNDLRTDGRFDARTVDDKTHQGRHVDVHRILTIASECLRCQLDGPVNRYADVVIQCPNDGDGE